MSPVTQSPPRPESRTPRGLLRRIARLPFSDLVLLSKAFLLLLSARCALRVMPVRWVIAWKQQPVRIRTLSSREFEASCDRIRWAIQTVADRAPVSFVCFPQALAAHALLAGNGIPTRLHYGVRRTAGKLETHAWLEAAGRSIVGGEVAESFSPLDVF